MATEFVEVQGKCKWFKHRDLDKYGKWSHQFYPTAESLEKLRALQAAGAKNVLHKDDEGYWMSLHRRPFLEKKDGTKVPLQPPHVTDKDGLPYAGNVGNGSDVTDTLEVYTHGVPNTTKKAKAFRWYGTRIDNLIPYTKADMTPEEAVVNDRIGTSPAPTWS